MSPATTSTPRLPPPPSPSPAFDLARRLDRLLTDTAPLAPADADLAEAVCALRWPKWPDYRGGLDLDLVRVALAGRPLDAPTLNRLGGAETRVPLAPARRGDRLPDAWPACRAALTPPEPHDTS